MNIRSTGLSILIGALFAIPATTATAVSPATDTSIRQGAASHLILADAHQHQGHQGGSAGQGHSGGSGHAGHGQGGGKGRHGGGDGYSGPGGYGKGDKGNMEHHGHPPSYAHSVAMQAEVLGLSDEQLGKIVRFHLKEDKQAHERIKQKMKESIQAFREAITDPAVDDETLRKLGQAPVDSLNEMIKYHIDERKAVRSMLTSEQIGKLKEVKSDHDH